MLHFGPKHWCWGKQRNGPTVVQVAEAAAAGKGVVATAVAQRVAQAKQAEVEELGLQLDEAEGHLAQAEAAGRARAAELATAVERGEQLQARLQVTEPGLVAILPPSLAAGELVRVKAAAAAQAVERQQPRGFWVPLCLVVCRPEAEVAAVVQRRKLEACMQLTWPFDASLGPAALFRCVGEKACSSVDRLAQTKRAGRGPVCRRGSGTVAHRNTYASSLKQSKALCAVGRAHAAWAAGGALGSEPTQAVQLWKLQVARLWAVLLDQSVPGETGQVMVTGLCCSLRLRCRMLRNMPASWWLCTLFCANLLSCMGAHGICR